MAFSELGDVLAFAEAGGRLLRPDRPVSARHEAAALLDLAGRAGKAVCVRVRESGLPVFGNVLYGDEVLCAALGVGAGELPAAWAERAGGAVPVAPAAQAPVLARAEDPGALERWLPVLTHYEGDSAPFVTTAVVSAFDPRTGRVARGVHRMEVRAPRRLGVALLNPPLSEAFQAAARAGRPLPAAVTLGHDPLTFVGAALPVPPGTDKLELAGSLAGRPVEVAAAPHTGIPVPARAEILLEGFIDPSDLRPDGPFGEISGYHVAFPPTPTFVVEAVHCRPDPLYHALLPTGPEADRILGLAAEASVMAAARQGFGFVDRVRAVPRTYGSAVVVRCRRAEPGAVRALLERILEGTQAKHVVAVAEDADPDDPADVAWSVVSRCQPDRDVVLKSGLRGHPIDPSARGGKTAKIGLDATGYGRVPGRRARIPARALAAARALWCERSAHA